LYKLVLQNMHRASRVHQLAKLAKRRSLAGELTLSCPPPSPDGWPLCG